MDVDGLFRKSHKGVWLIYLGFQSIEVPGVTDPSWRDELERCHLVTRVHHDV
jgi:hypothetical protein